MSGSPAPHGLIRKTERVAVPPEDERIDFSISLMQCKRKARLAPGFFHGRQTLARPISLRTSA